MLRLRARPTLIVPKTDSSLPSRGLLALRRMPLEHHRQELALRNIIVTASVDRARNRVSAPLSVNRHRVQCNP